MRDTSFGVIPLKKRKGGWYVLLIRHSNGKFWAFPKGHSEKGETPLQAASRELQEETGLTVLSVLFEQTLHETYRFTQGKHLIEKTVIYFVAEVKGRVHLQVSEVEASQWVKLAEAENVITFPESKFICRQVISLLQKLT